MAPSLNDLRRVFFGAGAQQSVSDAEYAYMAAAGAAGVNAVGLLAGIAQKSATNDVQQAGLAAVTPITGLAWNNLVVPNGKLGLVILWVPWIQGTVVTDTGIVKITDQADVQTKQVPFPLSNVGYGHGLAFELLNPGTYSRKGAFQRGAGTGTFTLGAGGTTTTSLLLGLVL